MPIFKNDEVEFEYTLTRRARRNVNFRIKSDGEIYISAPRYVSKKDLEAMIAERAEWLLKNQVKVKNKKQNTMQKEIQNGSQIFLHGQKFFIKLSPAKQNSVHFYQNILVLQIKENYLHSQPYIQHYFDQWLKDTTYALSNQLIDKYLLALRQYHLSKPALTIRTMTGRWGTCTPSQGKITINKNLMFSPQPCLEYVVLHELAHLIEANHSKRFYAIIAEVMPDWKERKNLLNSY